MNTNDNAQRYDFRNQLDILGNIVERAKSTISEEQRISLQAACKNHRFANRVQFTPYCKEAQHVMSMGELADLGFNDPGIQRIDPKAIERLLWGPYGMISHREHTEMGKDCVGKIGERPVVVYFQTDVDSAPERPANASGRHRNYAWQILLDAAGVDFELAMEQPMWVDKTIAANNSEYSMMMVLANGQQSRKQPALELKSYALTKKNVSITTIRELIATRLAARQTQMADVIATGVAMSLAPNACDSSYAWDRVKSSWTKAVRLSGDHKKALITMFKEDGDQTKNLISELADSIVEIIEEESERSSAKSLNTRVVERLTDVICGTTGLPKGTWPTDAETARKRLEHLTTQQSELKAYV